MPLPQLRKIPSWIFCGPGPNTIHCARCKKTKTIELPLIVDAFILEMHAFAVSHEDCKEV